MLARVDPRLQRCRPACGIHGRSLMGLALDGLPIDQEGDRILSLGHAIVWCAGGDPGSRAGHDTGRNCDVLQDPAADVDVVR